MREPPILIHDLLWFGNILYQASSVLLYFWYATLPLLILLIASLYGIYRHWTAFLKLWRWIVFAIVSPIVIAFVGAVFNETDSKVAGAFIYVLLLVYLWVYGVTLVRTSGVRLFVFAFGGLALLATFAVSFVAGMSITGTWL